MMCNINDLTNGLNSLNEIMSIEMNGENAILIAELYKNLTNGVLGFEEKRKSIILKYTTTDVVPTEKIEECNKEIEELTNSYLYNASIIKIDVFRSVKITPMQALGLTKFVE